MHHHVRKYKVSSCKINSVSTNCSPFVLTQCFLCLCVLACVCTYMHTCWQHADDECYVLCLSCIQYWLEALKECV